MKRFLHAYIIVAILGFFALAHPTSGTAQPRGYDNDSLQLNDSLQSVVSEALAGERHCFVRRHFWKEWLFTAGAGFQIGGSAPMPMPRPIRKVEGFNPLLCLSLEVQARKFIDRGMRWSAIIGLRFEQKGMRTKANVKGYHMEMTADDGGYMEGVWTGHVKTHVRNSYLTIPLLANYQISDKWSVHAGPYVSLLLDGNFNGEAFNGYLRHHDPTGEKAYVTHATYDFGDDLRRWNWGVQMGATYYFKPHFEATAQLTWGLNNIFKKDFNSISFALYPVYARIGVSYLFF